MPCGQALTHFPQLRQAEGRLPSSSAAMRSAGAEVRRNSLYAARSIGISSPAGQPSQQ